MCMSRVVPSSLASSTPGTARTLCFQLEPTVKTCAHDAQHSAARSCATFSASRPFSSQSAIGESGSRESKFLVRNSRTAFLSASIRGLLDVDLLGSNATSTENANKRGISQHCLRIQWRSLSWKKPTMQDGSLVPSIPLQLSLHVVVLERMSSHCAVQGL